MYRCDCCKKVSQPKESCNFVILQTRPKVYTEAGIEIGVGFEIVKGGNFCTACFDARQKALAEKTNETQV